MAQGDFFNAFDDGFDDVLSNRRSSSVAGDMMTTKPSENDSQNMLGELQKEISREESSKQQTSSKLIS